ncbi:MAG: mannitol-phosphate 5-dehydrogenase [Pseudonocardiales bacterium]|nr:mannitol-phosphate 5-dehydrogenase [Pseudonocardiales bacterium]
MRAVVIGAGPIGCGFAGRLLHRSGYALTLVGRARAATQLARVGRYTVRLTDGCTAREESVDGLSVLDVAQTAEIADAIGAADLVCTAVGPRNLDAVAPLLARGLGQATRPVTVIAFENAEDAGPRLRRLVGRQLGMRRTDRHGFTGAVVGAVFAHRLLAQHPGDDLLLIGEPHSEFAVDAHALRDPLPPVEGMVAVDDFAAFYLRKLYRYSAGHATAAYLGRLKGYRYLHAAVRDGEIRHAVHAAMAEGRAGLAAAYGDRIAGDEAELGAILQRFGNAALGDTVARVGRDVARKLGHRERLVGAARLAERAGVAPTRLAEAAAAALYFGDLDGAAGGAAPPMRRVRPCHPYDVADTLRNVAGLQPGCPLARRIEAAWLRLGAGWEDGNLLLTLDRPLWAWAGAGDHTTLARAS